MPSLPNREAVIRLVGAFAVASGRSDRWRDRWQLSNRWRPRGSLLEQNDEWAFRGFRRDTGATVPCTSPLDAGGKADGRVRRCQRGDDDRRPVNERHQL